MFGIQYAALSGSNYVRFYTRNGGKELRYSTNVVDSNWHHWCVTYDYGADSGRFYYDGVAQTLGVTVQGTENSGSSGLYVGGATVSMYMNGRMVLILFCFYFE